MAQRVIEVFTDDLDGNSKADETVRFALDGVTYEIDLTEEHAAELREGLERFIEAGRLAKGGHTTAGARTTRSNRHVATTAQRTQRTHNDREQNAAIRTWAQRKGKVIADRGRIPQSVVDEYNASAGK